MDSWNSLSEQLLGAKLDGGWIVRSIAAPGETGGNFSFGLLVDHPDGRLGFAKVVNYERASWSSDPTAMLHALTRAHIFERELVDVCRERGLTRVVRAYGWGNVRVEGMPLPLPYIVFERADGDVRHALGSIESNLLSMRLQLCHEATVAVRQLHGARIAHQDLKPSNLLVFEAVGAHLGSSKIADLGRASHRDKHAEHDDLPVAGDPGYAPPEQAYGTKHESFELRRMACDLYQLGSLCTFLLTDEPFHLLVRRYLHPAHDPINWRGSYGDVLAYVREAHVQALSDVEKQIGGEIGEGVRATLGELLDPDPMLRGDRRNLGKVNQFSLERAVSRWNTLAARAQRSTVRL